MDMPPFPEPVVTPREPGGWLAVSAPGEPLRLGVVGNDEHAARANFERSATRWLELCEAAAQRNG